MDSFELNKIIGALLGVIFVVFSVSLVSDAIFSTHAPEQPGYAIEVPEDTGQGEPEEEAPQAIAPLLASADPESGANIFKRCQACHTVEQGGANKVGPNLWGVVDRPIASHEGFGYSSALTEFSEDGSLTWTYERLDHFLESPKGLVSGTAMAFAGLSNIQDRADLIMFLRQHAESPAPLPDPELDTGGEDEDGAAGEGNASGEGEEDGADGGDGAQSAPAGEGQEAAPTEGGNGEAAGEQNGEAAPAGEGDGAPAESGDADAAPAEEGADESAAPADQGDADAPAADDAQATPGEDGQAPDAEQPRPADADAQDGN